jgi:hypothetical protein
MQEFHVISLDSFTAIGGSDVEGRLAVFGDAAISNYSVSYVVPPPTSTFYIDRSGNATPANRGAHVCLFNAFIARHAPSSHRFSSFALEIAFPCYSSLVCKEWLGRRVGGGGGGGS